MKAVHVALAASLIFLASPASAHHGPIGNPDLYLSENLLELEGEITEILWRNPHPRLRLRAVDENGQEGIWELELDGSPISYARRGVAAEDFAQIGDRVRIAGVAARFAPRAIGVLHYLRPDGRELVFRNRELRWSAVHYSPAERPLDPAKVAQARQTAQSIFRVWGGRSRDNAPPHPPLSTYERFLTEQGRELAADWVRARDDPELKCQQGMPTTMFDPVPMEIVNEGGRILIRIQEYDVERVIHMTAEAETVDPEPSPLGYSLGRWEGNTLVVTTTHVDWPQFDPYGTPQSDQTRYVERFSFSAEDEDLNYTFMATDPVMFTQPITFERSRPWTPGVELVPFNCAASWGDAAN
jgi:hypothetical protein